MVVNPSLYATSKDYLPFLPEGESPRAAYDPTRDVIWTVSETRLRMHSADTGKSAGYLTLPHAGKDDLEFYWDPPNDWAVQLKDHNPGTNLSQHPPECGTTTYPDHPHIQEGTFADVVDESQCSSSGDCPYEASPYAASCSGREICCVKNSCCIMDPSSYFENWGRFPYGGPGVGSRAVHVTAGRVNVVVQFSGYVDDEEDYYRLSLASFDTATDNLPNTKECTDQTSKPSCRAMVTPTGCYWSRTKGCINATKVS
jgi:hypothetical protein